MAMAAILVLACAWGAAAYAHAPLARGARATLHARSSHMRAADDASAWTAADHEGLYARAWWPVAFEAVTDRRQPVALSLLGAPIVLWWDPHAGSWGAALDRCPHRLAPLSEGRVDEAGRLECPYHGWAFGRDGACARVPQAEAGRDERVRARACATALEVAAADGIVWVWAAPLLGSDARADRDALERVRVREGALDGCRSIDYFRDLPMDATVLLENVLDPSHLPYTHHGTISSREAARPVPMRLEAPPAAAGFRLSRVTSAPGFVEFRAPSLVVSCTARPGSYRDWNVVWAVPIAPGRCRLMVRIIFEVAKIPSAPVRFLVGAGFGLPAPFGHLLNHAVLEDDNVFLHAQGRALAHAGARAEGSAHVEEAALLAPDWARRQVLATSADAGVIAHRRWLDAFTFGRGTAWSALTDPALRSPSAQPPWPREALLERLHSHTAQCSQCHALLRAVRRTRSAARALEWLFLAGAAGTAASAGGDDALPALGSALSDASLAPAALTWPLLAASAAALGAQAGCSALERRLTAGCDPPPRNRL